MRVKKSKLSRGWIVAGVIFSLLAFGRIRTILQEPVTFEQYQQINCGDSLETVQALLGRTGSANKAYERTRLDETVVEVRSYVFWNEDGTHIWVSLEDGVVGGKAAFRFNGVGKRATDKDYCSEFD
jgi:hypothetical protein